MLKKQIFPRTKQGHAQWNGYTDFYVVLFVWLISHLSTILFSQNKSATSNQSNEQTEHISLMITHFFKDNV
jgi:hypothetical protein